MKRNLPYITFLLMAVNVLVFGYDYLFAGGELMVSYGLYGPAVERGEWIRLLTSMFLHGNLQHLAGNMISLYFYGNVSERALGHVRFLVVYLLGGLIGSLFVVSVERFTGNFALTVGASGAIFAVLGSILIVAWLKRYLVRGISPKRVLFASIFSLASGIGVQGVSFTGHLGGFIGGVLVTLVLLLTMQRSKSRFG